MPDPEPSPLGPGVPISPGGAFGASPVGPEPTGHGRLGGRWRWMLGSGVALLFLISAFAELVNSGRPAWEITVGVTNLVAFAAAYVVLPAYCMGASLRSRVGCLVVLFGLSLPLFALLGPGTSSLWIFVAVAGGLLLAPAAALTLGVLLAAGMVAVTWSADGGPMWELALTLVAMTAFMVGFASNIRLTIELRRTQAELAQAAVAAERERIGRDLHDILGHSLTAITVKAGLARRLATRDAAAAAAEIGDVERLARQALADVRATASGYREVSLANELAIGATVLRAAGIVPKLPVAVDDVDPDAVPVLGFVVREGITNVVRHSGARTCTVTVRRRSVEIVDDGDGSGLGSAMSERPDPGSGTRGSGLRGLGERLQAVGGSLQAGPLPGGGFRLIATIGSPGPGPGAGSATSDRGALPVAPAAISGTS